LLLNRPDSFLFVGFWLLVLYKTTKPTDRRQWIALALPFVLIALPYGFWKLSYYGDIFPNSFNAKVRGFDGVGYGLFYFYLWMIVTLSFPFVALLAAKGKDLWRENRELGIGLLFAGLWTVYVIGVGGDFMDFRFMIPVTPFLLIGAVDIIRRFITEDKLKWALLALFILAVPNHIWGYQKVIHGYGIEKVDELANHLTRPDQNWIGVGERLQELFEGTDVLMAVGPAGAIPYLTKTPCVDIMGLTDATIPQISEQFSVVAGHRIIAPLDYLVKRRVNLVVQPITLMIPMRELQQWMQAANWSDAYRFYLDLDKPAGGRLVNEATMLAIPVNRDYALIVWYLTPHPVVERLIQEGQLTRFKLVRG